jgi:hypothetical protein
MTSLSEQQQLGRAKNVMSDYLTRKLLVPKIYFDANWNSEPIDLLAIDRAGVGDVHAVRMINRKQSVEIGSGEPIHTFERVQEYVQKFKTLPCQYRYIAVINSRPYDSAFGPGESVKTETFAEDGVGRIGILYLDLSKEDPTVKEILKAERFRSSQEILTLTDEYVAHHTADMEFRDPADFEVHA